MFIVNDLQSKTEERQRYGYRVNIEFYISKGFQLFRQKPELFIIYTLLFAFAMPFGGFLLVFPLTAGFFLTAHRINMNQPVLFDNFFDGFKDFIQLTLLMIVQSAVLFIGYLALVIPGIYLTVAYTFAPFYIIFGKMGFWDAMESSRKLVHREWFSIFGLIVVLALLNFVGLIAFGIGLLFTIPISFCALYVAFDDILNT